MELAPEKSPVGKAPVDVLLGLCDPERLLSAFQPIFRARTGELQGCEAFLRLPPGTPYNGPYKLFADANEAGLLPVLEMASTVRHLRDAEPYAGNLLIFLNLLAPVFYDKRFGLEWLMNEVIGAGRQPSQIVLELPEVVQIHDFLEFAHLLEPYRKEGFRVALDDFGVGYTNLRMIADLNPDFVKVDRVFIEGINSHARKRVLVESVVSLCHRVNCGVIAEGIEAAADLETCLAAGVDYLQGYLLAMPGPPEEAFLTDDLAMPVPLTEREHDVLGRMVVRDLPSLPGDGPVRDAIKVFAENEEFQYLPVVVRNRAIGVLSRSRAIDWISDHQEDVVSAGEAPLERLLEDVPFDQMPSACAVEEVVDLIRRRTPSRRFEPIIVSGPGQVFQGLLTVEQLLDELIRFKIEITTQTHPATRLPTRIRLETLLSEKLAEKTPLALTRVNVRGFAQFNSQYGFLRGDSVLTHLGNLLRERLNLEPGTFLSHYSADDFAFLALPDRIEAIAVQIQRAFGDRVPELYDPGDLENGLFRTRNRRQEPELVPLMQLSIGAAVWDGASPASIRLVTEEAEMALRDAKTRTVPVIRLVGSMGKTSARTSTMPLKRGDIKALIDEQKAKGLTGS